MEYVLTRWLAMSHSYVAVGISELYKNVACDYFCQLLFRLRKYIPSKLLKSTKRVLYCKVTLGQQNSKILPMPAPLVNLLSIKRPKFV